MLLVTQSDPVIQQQLSRGLADVAERFARELESDLPCVNDLVRHIESYRGKMLRPTLVLATALALRPRQEQTSPAHHVLATVVEMIHMATLVHDDILDEADLRRRGATVNALHGNEAAVMLGDYLISHAYHLCSSANLPGAKAITAATNAVCEGELLQLANRENWQLDEATYFEIIGRKTASLCGVCCSQAAVLLGENSRVTKALDNFGRKLGIAFQIIDDVLDLTGDETTVGKTLGRDLDKGKLTLPVIRALADVKVADRARLLEALSKADAATMRRLVRRSGEVDSARRTAGQLIAEAKGELIAVVGGSPARALLLDMADAVLQREY
ncbi:MAG: polyprenyl synthetase family protein [Phycisphaeraceae bacterium]|nr:polyprenyl synthetase family protein [Phycisphaeraceae bacterium]